MMKKETVPVIEINQLSFQYALHKPVLEDIQLSMHQGEFLGLVGPNGSGKSTLIKLILGLLSPNQGEIKLFGQPAHQFSDWSKIGYVSQKANSFNSSFPATVFEVVSTGLYGQMGLFKWLGKREKKRIFETLELVGLADCAQQNIGKLSGGQQQRTFIARALVSRPKLLILDEPTVGVDQESVNRFFDLIEYLHQHEGLSILLVSHDIGVITTKVDTIACLNRKLFFHGNTEEFTRQRRSILAQAYGHDITLIDHAH